MVQSYHKTLVLGPAESRRCYDRSMSNTELESIRQEVKTDARVYSTKKMVNPYTALLDEVQWRAGHVAALRDQLGMFTDLNQLVHEDEHGVQHESVMLKRYDKEREFLDRVCKLAISAGIAERYVQLAELQGQTLFRVMGRAFEAMGLTPAQRQAFGPALRDALAAEQKNQEDKAMATQAIGHPSSNGPVAGPIG